jgi:hypothetical protein
MLILYPQSDPRTSNQDTNPCIVFQEGCETKLKIKKEINKEIKK